LGEGVLTDLLRIVYENIFSNAPKTLYFARDFLMAGIAARKHVGTLRRLFEKIQNRIDIAAWNSWHQLLTFSPYALILAS